MDIQLPMFDLLGDPVREYPGHEPDDHMVIFSFCLPPVEADILRRRAAGNVSAYVRKRLSYDLKRNHHGKTCTKGA